MKLQSLLLFSCISTAVTAQISGKSETKNVEFNSQIQLIEKDLPPLLNAEFLAFIDDNHNDRIDALERGTIKLKISNTGKGNARNIDISVKNTSSGIAGLSFSAPNRIPVIRSGESQTIEIPINAKFELTDGTANFVIDFKEPSGFQPDPITVQVATKSFIAPSLVVNEHLVFSESGTISKLKNLKLSVLIQNTGQGTAQDVRVVFTLPQTASALGDEQFKFAEILPGESKQIDYLFIVSNNHTNQQVNVGFTMNEKYGKFGLTQTFPVQLDTKSATGNAVTIASNASDANVNIQRSSLTAEVDKNIPQSDVSNDKRYALIIGNEDYTSKQPGLSTEFNVAFAVNDAQIFKEYVQKTMGVPEQNITLITDATSGQMKQEIMRYSKIIEGLKGKGEFVFYYAGHGLPDEVTKTPYIMPTDVSSSNLTEAVDLFDLYKKISNANPAKATFYLDACFSGGGRDAGLVAARAVKIKPKTEEITGNLVIFAATNEEQTALPYAEKRHGMFTYHVLKAFQDSKGELTYSELDAFLDEKMNVTSLTINKKEQTPSVLVGSSVKSNWGSWSIK